MPEIQDYPEWAGQQINRLPVELRVKPPRNLTTTEASDPLVTPDTETEEQEKVNFFATLPLDEWKKELVKLRETGDLEALEKREIEIVHLIKIRLFELPYESEIATPEKIISCGTKNCAGASILGSICFEQLGIDHRIQGSDFHKLQHARDGTLISDEKKAHAFILVLGSNGHVFWSEMTNDNYPFMVNDEDITVKSTAEKVPSLCNDLKTAVNFSRLIIRDYPSFLTTDKERSLHELAGDTTEIFSIEPDVGRKALLLMWHAHELHENGRIKEAYQVYQAQVDMGLETPFLLVRLSNYQWMSGDRKAALETMEKLRQFPTVRSDYILDWAKYYLKLDRPEDYEALLEEYMIKNEDYKLCNMLSSWLFRHLRHGEVMRVQLKFLKKVRTTDRIVYQDFVEWCDYAQTSIQNLPETAQAMVRHLVDTIELYLSSDRKSSLTAVRNVFLSLAKTQIEWD